MESQKMGKQIKRRQTTNIPGEIVEEILLNLPVKSLLRFKCVSKPWRSLISSKYFIKRHLKKSTTNDDSAADFTHHNKLVVAFEYSTFSVGIGSFSLCNEPTIAPNLDNPPLGRLTSCVLVGSCNGLILINNQDINELLLWNPSTREVNTNIPPASFGDTDRGQVRPNLPNIYGFGYDEPMDDYKIVCTNVMSCQAKMYSSKTNSWKKIGDFDRGSPAYHSPKFVNGRFHWMAGTDGGRSSIVSLDLFDEKYESVGGPICFSNYDDLRRLELEKLGGYLSLMGRTHGGLESLSVWAMMEYGKSESWTKIWTLSDFVGYTRSCFDDGCPEPLCLKKNGNIAVAFGWDIVVSNGKNELRKSQVEIPYDRVDSIEYVESLVSCTTIWG